MMLHTHRDAETAAAAINEAHAAGRRVVVGDRAVKGYTSNSAPATVYRNGTLAVTVVGRTARVGVLYFKQGAEVAYGLGTAPTDDSSDDPTRWSPDKVARVRHDLDPRTEG